VWQALERLTPKQLTGARLYRPRSENEVTTRRLGAKSMQFGSPTGSHSVHGESDGSCSDNLPAVRFSRSYTTGERAAPVCVALEHPKVIGWLAVHCLAVGTTLECVLRRYGVGVARSKELLRWLRLG
jgi:hypothetical protein